MFEPTRGGTRGGQAEFKWADVSADKDRENYLGHSINAPTGRWQKNKDIHWYARDNLNEEEERAEIARIKAAEAEAMSVALGFEPDKTANTNGVSGANAIPVPSSTNANVDPDSAMKATEKEERRRKKEERRAAKEEKRAAKAERRAGKEERRTHDGHSVSRTRSRSPPPRRRSRSPARPRYLDEVRDERQRDYGRPREEPRRDYDQGRPRNYDRERDTRYHERTPPRRADMRPLDDRDGAYDRRR